MSATWRQAASLVSTTESDVARERHDQPGSHTHGPVLIGPRLPRAHGAQPDGFLARGPHQVRTTAAPTLRPTTTSQPSKKPFRTSSIEHLP